ncbi:MAG: T9SS type A sorting domain-containing protein [Bacteroidota bacterium]
MRRSRLVLSLALPLLLASGASGQSISPEDAEAAGIDDSAAATAAPSSATPSLIVCQDAVLLVPNSTNDGIDILDPVTGDLVISDFIADPTNLSTPISAIPNFAGDGILISDQLENVVQEYDCDGNFVGTFAPAGGVDVSILDNIRGISLNPGGDELWVTVASGANADAIARFDDRGNYLGNVFPNGDNGFDSPFDVLIRDCDFLSSAIDSDDIYSYCFDGTFNGIFQDATVALSFPEQLALASNENVLVADFSFGTILEFDPDGTLLSTYSYSGLGGFRGVYELPNGNLLITSGGGIFEVTRSNTVVRTVVSGKSARFIELFSPKASGGVEIDVLGATGIPQRNDFVFIRALATNNSASTIRTRVYFTVDYPDGSTRTYSVLSSDFPGGTSFQVQQIKRMKFPLTPDAPAGTYTVTVFAADDIANGGTIYDSDAFTFDLDPIAPTKAGEASGDASPNPFSTSTTIRYEVAEASDVDLRVYDVSGREVTVLARGPHEAGEHEAVFEAGDLPSGVYVWRLSIDGSVQTGRVTLAR